ncbi:rod shape-determining protein RodA [Pelotomaculum isophthalicicum JI]|uniref:Peptidoglycan glycosyltransferase RodA n=1 Tax=Pelotomaculum isophthalicicum JI TaxID=947010 RepID=A0A9X4H6B2_9FIRM|nr:rod shape-determining protein RodA [Pelotomaculum isophthalicicum]MDF9408309.1 rod shape-determining protein RodA [Pelotomaculum isophthalicicum JI]
MLIQSRFLKKLDHTILISVSMIILLGLIVIYSATKPTELLPVAGSVAKSADPFAFVKRQIIFVFLGIGMMCMMLYIHYEDLIKHMKSLYIINLIMLGAVIFFGVSELGAQRWISIMGFHFQPSEFSKLIIIVCFAAFLTSRKKKLNRFRDLLPSFAFFGVPIMLILKQPDLGTALVFFAVMFGMLFVSGANPRLLVLIIVVALGAVSLWIWAHFWLEANRGVQLWMPLKDYQLNRLIIFINPWQDWHGAGYNVIQSQIAIGQGGFWGRGLFQGSQTHGDFLPIQETDFIFSVVGEELGFIGAVILLTLYFIVIYRCILITMNAKDDFGTLLAAGVVSMLTFHVLVNVGMTCGIMPVTGIPLPMFSSGGSSMITNLAALGLLLNINMRRQKIMF